MSASASANLDATATATDADESPKFTGLGPPPPPDAFAVADSVQTQTITVDWGDPLLNQWLRKWQAALWLGDWDIKIRWAAHWEMADDAQAEVDRLPAKRQATIKILKPEEYPQDSPWSHEMELSVVHELIHIVLQPMEGRSTEDDADADAEYIVHRLARALHEMGSDQASRTRERWPHSRQHFT